MDYILTKKQLDSLLKRYFDKVFNDAYYKGKLDRKGAPWGGFVKPKNDGTLLELVSHTHEIPYLWFTNGQYFYSVLDHFNVKNEDFNDALKRYLINRYEVNIENIM